MVFARLNKTFEHVQFDYYTERMQTITLARFDSIVEVLMVLPDGRLLVKSENSPLTFVIDRDDVVEMSRLTITISGGNE